MSVWDDTYERELARCSHMDIGYENMAWLSLRGVFEYEDGGGQGLGYVIDGLFIKRFMSVFGVESLQNVNGKECWVTHSHSDIKLIEPLFKKDGTAFDIHAWRDELKAKSSK